MLLYIFIAFLLVGLILTVARKRLAAIFGIVSIVGMAVAACIMALQCFICNHAPSSYIFEHPYFGQFHVACDGLSAWFVLIISVIFIVGTFYGRAYLKHYSAPPAQHAFHWLSVIVTFAGMMILFTTDNLIIFLVGWEMMAIGSFFAVIFENERAEVLRAGINYFIQSHIAVLLITAAFGWAYSRSGALSFSAIAEFMRTATDGEAFALMMMLVAGFGFKAGLIPFHSWLPHAHPAAPSHVSAMMSGVIVKAGIYGILRFGSFLTISSSVQVHCGVAILLLGILSALYGIVNAAVHRDFKRMLAYCTIENVGIIAVGIGLGFIGLGNNMPSMALLGFGGALLHTLNHALFKALLFFGAGNVYVSTHTRNMEQLGGLVKSMPQTAVIFLLGSIAIGGLPPFGGFISEILIYSGFLQGFAIEGLAMPVLMILSGGALAIVGGVSMLAFTKSFGVIFLGTPRKKLQHGEPQEVSPAMLAPAFALLLPIIAVILFPERLFSATAAIASQMFRCNLATADIAGYSQIFTVLSGLSKAFLILLIIVMLVMAIRRAVSTHRPITISNTWSCGYERPIKGIQYTSKSFARTLIDFFKIILPSRSDFEELRRDDIFPVNRKHSSSDGDFWETRLVAPANAKLLSFLGLFKFIQNGDLQRYIVYGLFYTLLLVASVAIF